jgi:hypothetical protein
MLADLLPTPASKRTFAAADFAALWVTLVISITTYYLAASLVDMGEQQQQRQQQQQQRQVSSNSAAACLGHCCSVVDTNNWSACSMLWKCTVHPGGKLHTSTP